VHVRLADELGTPLQQSVNDLGIMCCCGRILEGVACESRWIALNINNILYSNRQWKHIWICVHFAYV